MAEVEISEDDAVFAKARIVGDKISKAADEEQSPHKQHHRNSNLGDDQRLLKRESLAALRRATASAFERDAWIRLRGGNCGPQIENRASEQRQYGGESENAP